VGIMTSAEARPSIATRSDIAEGIRRGLLVGAAVLAIVIPPAGRSGWFGLTTATAISTAAPAALPAPGPRFADFGTHTVSPDARHVADWIADSRDNANTDFVIVDKKYARVYVFDANARLRDSTPVLLGAARGDDTVPGIGSRPIAEVLPHERTTPAGRFVAELGRNALGEDVVWVDYDAAVSMHRVRTTNPKVERRLQRLATPSIDDNRISYGCINVPVAFYETFIRPAFAAQRAVVYVLPEVKPVQQVFGSYDVATAQGRSVTLSSKLRTEH
jgi:hypothetical protein